MTEINLDHLLSVLEKVSREDWRENHHELKHEVMKTFSTEILYTKVHQPLYRDIPGYYNVILQYCREVDGNHTKAEWLSLSLFRNDILEFSEYGDLKEDTVTTFYKALCLATFKGIIEGLSSAPQRGDKASLAEALRLMSQR